MSRTGPEPMVDGLAWSGFDRAVRHVPGGAAGVFRAIGVPLQVIGQPGQRMPFSKYVRYFEVAARLSGDPHFGLRFGLRTRAQHSGVPGYLVLNARRLRDAIHDLARTLPTLVEGIRVELIDDREPPAVLWWGINTDLSAATQFVAHANAYFVRMLQAHRGRQWRPARVLYSIPEPAHPERYRAGLGCPVVFGAPVNVLELRREELSAERVEADPHLHTLLLTYARFLLGQNTVAPDFEAEVRVAIRDALTLRRADLTFIADRLRLSRRSLQRALSERGLTFSSMRADERLGLAHSLIVDGMRSIGDIATSLGYTETAALSRAFRARFGFSPRAARHRSASDRTRSRLDGS